LKNAEKKRDELQKQYDAKKQECGEMKTLEQNLLSREKKLEGDKEKLESNTKDLERAQNQFKTDKA
jgi:chromosome segregation ATPase